MICRAVDEGTRCETGAAGSVYTCDDCDYSVGYCLLHGGSRRAREHYAAHRCGVGTGDLIDSRQYVVRLVADHGQWVAQIGSGRRIEHVGTYPTATEAETQGRHAADRAWEQQRAYAAREGLAIAARPPIEIHRVGEVRAEEQRSLTVVFVVGRRRDSVTVASMRAAKLLLSERAERAGAETIRVEVWQDDVLARAWRIVGGKIERA